MSRSRFLVTLSVICLAESAAGRADGQQRREPLPLDVAVAQHAHNSRSSFNLSGDGQWIAHTWSRDDRIVKDGRYYSPSGVPIAEGDLRMQAGLTNTRTGEVRGLGGTKGSSWAPVWSPDGKRVAFYADDDGETGVWIWERATGQTRRFPGVIARPFFGFEVVRWSADGQRLLCKILPAGMTIAQANALAPASDGTRRVSACRSRRSVGAGAERPCPQTRRRRHR